METVSNLFVSKAPVVAHKHRPRTIKVCFNTNYVIMVYCADCGCQLSQYIQEIEYEECPIGVTDNTEFS